VIRAVSKPAGLRLIAVFVLTALALLLGASAASGGGASLRVISYVRKEDDSVGVVLRVVAGVGRPCHGRVSRGIRRVDLVVVGTNKHGAAQWSWEVMPGVPRAVWRARVLCGRNDREVNSGAKTFLVERTPGRRKGRRLLMHRPHPENPRGLKERVGGRPDPRYSSRPASAIRLVYTKRPDLPDLGSAGQWITRAVRTGFPTGSRPLLGAIAWFPPNRNGVGPYGHVAYVTAVSGDMISIQEYDGEQPVVRRRTIAWAGLQFIYHKGESAPPVPPPPPLPTNVLSSRKVTAAPGTSPSAIAWDGTASWIGDAGGTIFKLDDAGRVAGTFKAPPGDFAFRQGGLVFTGANFAVVDGTGADGTIYDFIVTGSGTSEIARFPAPPLDWRYDAYMTWDGSSLWLANGYKVYKLSPSGSKLFEFGVAWPIQGIAADGSNLWLAHSGSALSTTLDKVSPAGVPVATYTTRIGLMQAMAWINGSLFALGAFSSYDIYKVDAPS
jgi:surface antigen